MRDNSRIIRPAGRPFNGEITVPGDKSISHRAVMFGAIAKGTTRIRNFLMGADCLSTIDCFRRLGVEIDVEAAAGQVTVHGNGLRAERAAGSGQSAWRPAARRRASGDSGIGHREQRHNHQTHLRYPGRAGFPLPPLR